MKLLKLLLVLLLFLGACSNLEERTQKRIPMSENIIQTDEKKLSHWFNLSKLPQPDSLQWVQKIKGAGTDKFPSPTDYYIVALLKYNKSTIKLVEQLDLLQRGDVYVEDSLLENWMPPDVVDNFVRTPEGYLKFNGTAYVADSVLLSPLSYGYIIIAGDYILIYGATN